MYCVVVVSNATCLTKSDRGPGNLSSQGARSTPVVGFEHHTGSHRVDDKKDEDNSNNECSKGPSNANAFSVLETAMDWYKQQSECCPSAAQENLIPCSEKMKFGLAIHQNDQQASRRFVEWAENEIAVVPDFHERILFSDEAHFWLNGYVSKQNCRIWSEANREVYVKTLLHPEKLTVWCALWAGGIIDPYFFKNNEGHSVTVNGDRYRAIITNFLFPELNNHDAQELWF
ncbi:putative DD41D transposase [Trichonephila clavipes]|nr:putative DD41D transposase [Trichonephila clavipes]